MNKNKSILKLFAVVVLFIVYSCAKNSETIKIHTDEYNIIANVMKDSIKISSNGDTIYILNGKYEYSDSLNKIKGEFSEGVLDGIFSYEHNKQGNYLKYSGHFKKGICEQATFDEYNVFFNNNNPSNMIDRRFFGELGYPDGEHSLSLKDYIIGDSTFTGIALQAHFSNGKPDKTWKQFLPDGTWREIEYKDGYKLNSKELKNKMVVSETIYASGSKSIKNEYEYDENSNLIKKEILYFDGYKRVIEHYNTKGELIRKIADDKEYIYENGVEIGVIVEVFITSYPYAYGIEAMDVPKGKIWTPLYYEVSKSSNRSYNPPYIYLKDPNSSDSYLRNSRFPFPEKSDYVSFKVSKQMYKPFTYKKNFAVAATSWEIGENNFHLYFFEENEN